MGRARRNQRDAIRKSRIKKRNRGKTTSDDESSGEDYALPRIQHVAKKSKTSTVATADINQKIEEQESSAAVATIKEPSDNKSEATTTEEHGAAPINKSEEDKKETPKKPLDRIERMRLKKQQQKARRKEKKAAREAAQSK